MEKCQHNGLSKTDKFFQAALLQKEEILGAIRQFQMLSRENRKPFFKKLIEYGAEFIFLLQAAPSFTKEEISAILKLIELEPHRAFNAPHNWLYFDDQFSSPLIYEPAGEPVLICKNNWPLIQAIIQFAEMKLQKPSLVQELI